MSIILDALRKVEQEKRLQQQPQIDIKQRLLQEKRIIEQISPFANRMILGGLVVAVLASAVFGVYRMATVTTMPPPAPVAQNPARVEPIAVKPPEKAPVAAPVEPNPQIAATEAIPEEREVNLMVSRTLAERPKAAVEPSGRGTKMEKLPASHKAFYKEQVEKRAGSRESEEEVFPTRAASPLHREKQDVIAAGTEPPAARKPAQAAPASVSLDGIIFHTDPLKRSALLRIASQDSSTLVKIGDIFGGHKVENIEQGKVALSFGGKSTELRLE